MAAAKGKAKTKSLNHLYKTYKVSGERVERSNKWCPKCGHGFTMAKHKDRRTCGKCGYMEK